MNPFREFHLLKIFDAFETTNLPIDAFLRNYFRLHKAIGAKDRNSICTMIYMLIRWKGLIDFHCQKPITWKHRIDTLKNFPLETMMKDTSAPLNVRLSFPKILFEKLENAYGEEKAEEICLSLNEQAPTTIRINPLKTTREKLIEKWKSIYEITPCKYSSLGIQFSKRINFFGLKEFKDGLFEIQDEGSQLIAKLIQAKPGDEILDFCAGSGGKTLAFAHCLQGKGQIYLHDIRPEILIEAKKRLKRAGIQNAQCLSQLNPSYKKRMQWILVDAPCSGSGTLRRNPDQKWKFTEQMLSELVEKQRAIFNTALNYLHPQGTIIYATCSILPEENQKQVDFFLQKYPLKLSSPSFYSIPCTGSMDGFFAAAFKYN